MDWKEITRKMRLLELQTRKESCGLLAGEFRSAFRGAGMEFEEVREYLPGDDVRSIDWNVTARQGKPYLKRFREERELTIFFLVDCSASSRFGGGPESLGDLAAQLCASLAFSAVKSNDKTGLLLFSDRVEKYLPPGKGVSHAMRLVREVVGHTPAGEGTDLPGALETLGRTLKRRSVLFLLSDFLAPGDFQTPLQRLARRHDVIALPLRDPSLEELPQGGLMTFHDPETHQDFLLDTSCPRTRAAYRQKIRREQTERERQLTALGVDTLPLSLGEDVFRKLSVFLKRRARRP
ncbi:MAG: DUF58 domain-containing protein [Oligosphaeraceae bacterium]